ncbi:MAG: metallophosphoesterase [Bacteroidales bacterium]|nr:metallophosphoesterase [Bacteroidales bacterium]
MKNTYKTLVYSLLFAALITTVSCNRLDILGMAVNRSDTEVRVSDWLAWNDSHDAIVIDSVPDTYTFYSCSDIHINDDNSRFTKFITIERNDPQAIFSIIAGDLANESGEKPYILADSAMAFNPAIHAENDPCFPIIGNHDVYFDCVEHYKNHFHTSTYAVTVKTNGGKQDLYLFLDSGNGTHGKLQLEWLEEQLANRLKYRYCFVISHNWLFRTTYNYTTTPAANLPEDEQYAFMNLMSENQVNMVVMGHFHYRDVKTFDGVKYVMTDNLNEGTDAPSYLAVTCGDKVTYEYRLLDE